MSKKNWALWNAFKQKLIEKKEDLTMAQYDELKKELGAIRTDVYKLKSQILLISLKLLFYNVDTLANTVTDCSFI